MADETYKPLGGHPGSSGLIPRTVYSGIGAPTSTAGVPPDALYINEANGSHYKNQNGTWTLKFSGGGGGGGSQTPWESDIDGGGFSLSNVYAVNAVQITVFSLTADKALFADGDGTISSSPTTSAELGYLSGVTSALQTQLNAKIGLASLSATLPALYNNGTGVISLNAASANTASYLVQRDVSGNFAAGTITAAVTGAASSNVLKAGDTMTGLLQFSGTAHAGLQLNSLTTTQRDAIVAPANGMLIYNSTTDRLNQYAGGAWKSGFVRLEGDTMTGALVASITGHASLDLALTGGTISGGLAFSGTAQQGLVVLNLTTTQRDALGSGAGAAGGIIFNTTTNRFNFNLGTATWKDHVRLDGDTMTGALLFTDNTVDIGASGATRPRTGYFGTSVVSPLFTGALTGHASLDLALTGGSLSGLLTLDTTGVSFGSSVLILDAANVLAQRNSTTAQEQRTYGTFTDSSNFNRIGIKHLGGTSGAVIEVSALGTGGVGPLTFAISKTAAAPTNIFNISTGGHILFNTDNVSDIGATGATRPRNVYAGTQFLSVNGSVSAPAYSFATNSATGMYYTGSSVNLTNAGDLVLAGIGIGIVGLGGATASFPSIKRNATVLEVKLADDSAYTQCYARTMRTNQFTVATLPSASTSGAGATAFVTDSLTAFAAALGAAVTGGGSNKVTVFSDGTNWIVG